MHRFLFLFLLLLAACSSQTKIVTNVTEREANEIIVLLSSRGIPADKAPAVVSAAAGAGGGQQMWDVMVASDKITEAISVLNQAGLPRAKGTSLLDLFGKQGLVPSDMQDKIRYQEGLSEQLATTIRKMDGIIDANVQITFPTDEEAEKQEMTASVYVKHRGALESPNSLLVTKIKRLVASAVPGLSIDNVTVVSDRALIADITLQPLGEHPEAIRDYVSIWGIVVAKESAPRFRVIFYIFLVILFILLCAVAWLVWKVFPLLRADKEGWKSLFHVRQIGEEKPKDTLPPTDEDEEEL